jgi:protein SCO1/2
MKQQLKPLFFFVMAIVFLGGALWFSYSQTKSKQNYNPYDQVLNTSLGEKPLSHFSKGKMTVLYFGFLTCPVICPTTLSEITSLLKEFSEEELSNISVLFIGLDPERDTLKKMMNYTKNFHPKIIPANLDLKSLDLFTAAFGIAFMKVPLKSSMGYTIDHSTQILVVSPDQKEIKMILHDDSRALKKAALLTYYKNYFKKEE